MSRDVCLEVCVEVAIDGEQRRRLGSGALTPPYASALLPHGARRFSRRERAGSARGVLPRAQTPIPGEGGSPPGASNEHIAALRHARMRYVPWPSARQRSLSRSARDPDEAARRPR
jgi:hypothetical protein